MKRALQLIIGERRNPGRVKLVEVAIENVEAEVAHLGTGDAKRLADGARRGRLVLVFAVVLK